MRRVMDVVPFPSVLSESQPGIFTQLGTLQPTCRIVRHLQRAGKLHGLEGTKSTVGKSHTIR